MRLLRGFACAFLITSAFAQTPTPLPPNYKVILDSSDVLVQRVHYGPHEFVPMHDHPAATTVYVYLNDSGVVDITHEGPAGSTVHRPPTHAGAFRISPGNFERHSVQNTSDLPSDFLRIELKNIPPGSITSDFRGPAPGQPYISGTSIVFERPGIRIERIVCASPEDCVIPAEKLPSLIARILLKNGPLQQPVFWMKAGHSVTYLGTSHTIDNSPAKLSLSQPDAVQIDDLHKYPQMGTADLPLEILRIEFPQP
jgi:hypothetical protein